MSLHAARVVAAILTTPLVLTACGSAGSPPAGADARADAPATSVVVADRPPATGPTAYVDAASAPVEVAYGSDPLQAMDVYASSGPALGTVIYVHGGGWNGGSKDVNTSPLVLSTSADGRDAAADEIAEREAPGFRVLLGETRKGWDVVSIDYRLATSAPGPGIRASQQLADVDRAVRFVRAHAHELGLDVSTVVLAGGSAGGHLALLHAQTAPTNEFADPFLPPELAAVPATVDAVAGLVAPTDLHTFWTVGGIAPVSQESLLGCTLAAVPTIPGMGPCDPAVVDRFSPSMRSKDHAAAHEALPPAYFAYGGKDTLVPIETQGTPNIEAWAAAAGEGQTWVDTPASGTHNIDDQMNYLAFDAWLDHVHARSWDRRGCAERDAGRTLAASARRAGPAVTFQSC